MGPTDEGRPKETRSGSNPEMPRQPDQDHINPTATPSPRPPPQHRGRSHDRIVVNPNDAIIVILSDALGSKISCPDTAP